MDYDYFTNDIEIDLRDNLKHLSREELLYLQSELHYVLSIVFGVSEEIIEELLLIDYRIDTDYIRDKVKDLYDVLLDLRKHCTVIH